MKILLGNDTVEMVGGAEQYLFNLERLLKSRGHRVEVFGKEKFGTPLSFITRIYDPVSYLRFLRKIDEFGPDIIHLQGISRCISPSVIHAAKKRDIPVVQTVHDFHLVCPKSWFIGRNDEPCQYGFGWDCLKTGCVASPYYLLKTLKVLLHRGIIGKNVDVMVSPSRVLAGWLRDNLAFPDVRVLPNFISDPPLASPVERTNEIVFFGRLTLEKGAEYLIQAMPYIIEKIADARLFIIGEGPQKQSLQELASRLGVNDRVTFTGWLDHDALSKYVDSAQVVCVPSVLAENCPLVLIETVAHHRPIVATDIGGNAEIVKDGENGYLIEPRNTLDLAEKVTAVLSDFEMSRIMAEKAGELAEEYTEENHYRQLMDIYQSLHEA